MDAQITKREPVASAGLALTNKMLKRIEANIGKKLDITYAAGFTALSASAIATAFDAHNAPELVQGFNKPGSVEQNIASICADILQSVCATHGLDPEEYIPVVVPAAAILMCHLLEYAEGRKLIRIGAEVVSDCSVKTTDTVMAKFGMQGGAELAQVA